MIFPNNYIKNSNYYEISFTIKDIKDIKEPGTT